MTTGYRRVVKSPEHLRKGKQHIVVYENKEDCNLIAESCSNCFVIHSKMDMKDWADMINDFNEGFITTLIVHKIRASHGWRLDKTANEVDVVFTYNPTPYDILRANARLQNLTQADILI